jgi:hypothetical protein
MTDTLPRVGVLDQLRATGRKVGAAPRRAGGAVGRAGKSVAAPFGRVAQRVRENPRIAVAIACGVLLLLAWIGWTIYVANENGASAGLGVMIAWPAMVAALALISLPFIGGYMLIRSPSIDGSGDQSPPKTETAGEADEADSTGNGEPEDEVDEDVGPVAVETGNQEPENEEGDNQGDEAAALEEANDDGDEEAESEQAAAS